MNNGRLLSDSLQLTRIQKKADKEVLQSETPPPFIAVNRVLRLGLDWHVETRVSRMAPDSGTINLEVPLLSGESVLSEQIKLSGEKVMVSLGAAQRQMRWFSKLEKTDLLKLTAPMNTHWVEKWTLDVSPIFHMEYDGIPPIVQQSQGEWKPQFAPWPGETLTLSINRPKGYPGNSLAIDRAHLIMSPGNRSTLSELKLTLRSSRGGQHMLTLPENAVLESVTLDGKVQPIRLEGQKVTLPLRPGTQNFNLKFKTKTGVSFRTTTPDLDLGAEAANVSLQVRVKPRTRWVLFADGPNLGPAILFWGEQVVVLILAIGFGRIPLTPLKTRHWILLGIAMSTIAVTRYLIVVGWLFALAKRATLDTKALARWQLNCLQGFLGLLTLVAVVSLFTIIPSGLLGSPEMDVVGNGSSANIFNWYQDRVSGALPVAGFVSVPLILYRMAILLWALWMAFALLKWLRWGWGCFSSGELWRAKVKKVKGPAPAEAQS